MKRTTTGKRNRRVSVISFVQVSDGMGGFSVSEQVELTAWARIRRLWGTEGAIAGAPAGRQMLEVFIPASDAARQVGTEMILRDEHSAKRFNIRDVSESEDRAEVMMMCESGVPA